MEAKAPQQLSGLIARVLLEIVLRGAIQKVHELRILGLGKPVHDLADEQVEVQLAPQYAQRAAPSAIQNGLGHAQDPPETADDSAHRRYFDVARRVSDQVHIASL